MAKKQTLRADTNKRAKKILDIIIGENEDRAPKNEIKLAAATLGRLGGLKGGQAKAKKLSPRKRSAIAKKEAKSQMEKDK